MASLDEDLAEFEASPQKKERMRCKTGQILASLPPETAERLSRLVDDPTKPAPQIAAILAEHGIRIASQSLTRHRRRVTKTGEACLCP